MPNNRIARTSVEKQKHGPEPPLSRSMGLSGLMDTRTHQHRLTAFTLYSVHLTLTCLPPRACFRCCVAPSFLARPQPHNPAPAVGLVPQGTLLDIRTHDGS